MPEFFKSKLGMSLAGIYILLIFYTILEVNSRRPHSMDGLGMLILTAPCSFLMAVLFDSLRITSNENDPFLYLYVAFGGLINASLLYFLGYILTRIFQYFSSNKKTP